MPTDKPRVTFALSEDEFKLLEDYRHKNKCKSLTQAILELIHSGMVDEQKEAPASEATDEEAKPEEPKEPIEILSDAMVGLGLIDPGEDITDEDADFLIHTLEILRAYFRERRRQRRKRR